MGLSRSPLRSPEKCLSTWAGSVATEGTEKLRDQDGQAT